MDPGYYYEQPCRMALSLSNSLPVLPTRMSQGECGKECPRSRIENAVCCGILFRMDFALPPKG
jgi:hypothetical protein